jgi:hypothetical protein
MSNPRLRVNGTTPIKGEPYSADFMFDEDFVLQQVVITSRRGSGIFSAANLRNVLEFVRGSRGALALWNDSGEQTSLESYLRGQGCQPLAGCLADVFRKMGFSSIDPGPPVRLTRT